MSDRTATILVQAAQPRPGAAQDVAAALAHLDAVGTVVATLGAYEAVVTVTGPSPEAIAAVAARIGEIDVVGRTLTLPHLEEVPSDE